MDLQEINNLAEDPGSVSWPIKLLVLLALAGLVIFMGYNLIITESIGRLDSAKSTEQELKTSLETKQRRASQLEAYEQQLSEMQRSFGNLMLQLPSQTEIPSLIIDISEKGVTNGLEIVLFEPLKEESKEFYAEKPIKLIALGTYRQLATFVSDISGLSRIVTIHDIHLEAEKSQSDAAENRARRSDEQESQRLRMEAMIKTYRYLEDVDLETEVLAKKN